ncbi:MAG TPA: hypothetical protein VEG65_03150 [Candidatus Bathyarchaeia archaeon]|nr:hypothetical protein [Candidatus Bathyarchaeia archaeon]
MAIACNELDLAGITDWLKLHAIKKRRFHATFDAEHLTLVSRCPTANLALLVHISE